MKLIKIIILFIFTLNFCRAQNTVDTSKVYLNAKMELFPYAFTQMYDSKTLQGFIDFHPDIRTISSTGFDKDEVFFFELHAKSYIDYSFKLNFENKTTGHSIYFSNIDYKFIFGYNIKNESLYLLNDINQNDFKQFTLYFEEFCSGKYTIENLDKECLCKNARRSRVKCDFPSIIYDGVSW